MAVAEAPVLFSAPQLAREVEKLTPEEIDALAFGVIRLDQAGKVILYSARERRITGFRQEAVDRAFFSDVAPCLDTPAFRGRMERALANGGLDVEFTEFMDLPDGSRDAELRIRMQSASGGGCWLFLSRQD